MLTRNNIRCFQFSHMLMRMGIKHPLLIGHKMVTGPFPQSTYSGGHDSGCTILGEHSAGTDILPGTLSQPHPDLPARVSGEAQTPAV